MGKNDIKHIVNKVSTITIIANIVLAMIKFLAGVIAKSEAMISDSVHSASDVITTIIVIIGVYLSSKDSDKEHPYGHERLECVTAIILSMILAFTGLMIAFKSLANIDNNNLNVPGNLALIAAIVSIITKEIMFWYTKINAEKIKSGALLADAWHHRSDALSSVGALVGILFAQHGFPVMDSIASLVIFIFILKASVDIFTDAVDKLVDKSCDDEFEDNLRDFINKQGYIDNIDKLQTRLFGNKVYADIEISMNGELTLQEAHNIADKLHDSIEKEFDSIKHIMIHINPS